MKKVRRTPIPIPGSSSRGNAPATPSKQPLSEEFINDSDNSVVEETPKPARKEKPAKQPTPINIAVHRPKTNGVLKRADVPLPKQSSTPKKAVNFAPSVVSSSSDESDNEVVKSKEGTQQENGNRKASDDESSSSSGSEESSDESEEEAAQDATHRAAVEPSKTPQSHIVEFRPAKPFEPPQGFKALHTPLNTSSSAVKIFENLEGKQIWHITAPAGVSISELKEVAMDQALKGTAILTHKNTDYGFTTAETSVEGSKEVLIPRQSGYRAVSARISQTLHLQQVVRLPKLSSAQANPNTGSQAAASITQSTVRAPRPQLKGLKMRYFHSGFGDEEPGIIGSSDSEGEPPAPAGLAVPNGVEKLKKSGKRKHEEANSTERAESPTKKHKKHRTPEEIKKREERRAKKERRREKEKTKP